MKKNQNLTICSAPDILIHQENGHSPLCFFDLDFWLMGSVGMAGWRVLWTSPLGAGRSVAAGILFIIGWSKTDLALGRLLFRLWTANARFSFFCISRRVLLIIPLPRGKRGIFSFSSLTLSTCCMIQLYFEAICSAMDCRRCFSFFLVDGVLALTCMKISVIKRFL